MCDPASVIYSYLYLCRQQSQYFVTEDDHLLWFGLGYFFLNIIEIFPETKYILKFYFFFSV